MRTALLILAILIPTVLDAREGDLIVHTTAEYLAAYSQARTYAVAHLGQERQPSCRRAIGKRPAQVIEQRCLDVSASTSTRCVATDSCAGLLDGLDAHCLYWKGNIGCVYPEDGGIDVMDPAKRGSWRRRAP